MPYMAMAGGCRHCSCPASVVPCPPLPEMLARKLNAVSGVGRRVAGGSVTLLVTDTQVY
ncbi:MAG: hypothetical protein KAU38_08535 [Desulfobacterales bacterium]|nr:hypothetical protein [Desulfobacterales bacterium]